MRWRRQGGSLLGPPGLPPVQLLGDRRVVLEGVAEVGVRFGVPRLEVLEWRADFYHC